MYQSTSLVSLLPLGYTAPPMLDPDSHYLDRGKDTVAFFLTLDSINFGSGYFPHLIKRPGMSGYYTVANSLHDHYKKHGPLSAEKLEKITIDECTTIFGQDSGNEIVRELMHLFSTALNDLGQTLIERYNGSFIGLLKAAGSSVERLVRLLV